MNKKDVFSRFASNFAKVCSKNGISITLNDDFPTICMEDYAPLENTNLGVINTPTHLQSLVVNLSFKLDSHLHKYVVFLPHPDSTDLENLKNIKSISENINFNISSITYKI